MLRLEGVTKSYRLGSERSNWRALIPGPRGEHLTGEYFKALDDVSLEVRSDQAIGIVGQNGAGKSTLLKVLAGIVRPTSGDVHVQGRVASVIELGVGFNPELTGAENLRFAGSLFGARPAEIQRHYDEIVDFSGLEAFMDMPVKRYSTGMRARLGFAIATAVDPDVLLLDEVLATGDQVFREKSRNRVIELAKGAKAIVLVTHDMHWVTEFCNRAMLLEKGEIVAEGAPEDIVSLHQEHSLHDRARKQAELIARLGDSPGFSTWAIDIQGRIRAARAAGEISDGIEGIEQLVLRDYERVAADNAARTAENAARAAVSAARAANAGGGGINSKDGAGR